MATTIVGKLAQALAEIDSLLGNSNYTVSMHISKPANGLDTKLTFKQTGTETVLAEIKIVDKGWSNEPGIESLIRLDKINPIKKLDAIKEVISGRFANITGEDK